LSWEEACSFPLTALTAYIAERIDSRIPLEKGSSIFINGGSGGVGLYALQIARHLVGETGTVVTTCSARNIELVKENGANDVIDYTTTNPALYLCERYKDHKFDFILDAIGSFEIFNACATFLKPRGVYIMIGAPIPSSFIGFLEMGVRLFNAFCLPGFLGGVPRKFRMTLLHTTKETVQAIGELVEQKVLKPAIDSLHTFDDEGIKGAYGKMMSGRARGKIVVNIQ
jgi:reticulon-4-interacting protein 1, mitochondrial